MSPRLAIVLSHPVQYYSPWFRWMARHTDLPLRVFYLWDAGVTKTRDPQFGAEFAWDVDLLSGYEHEFVPNVSSLPGTDHFNGLNNPTLTRRLQAWQPAAVLLFGYNYRSHLQLLVWARFHSVPVIFRGDSHLLGRSGLPWWKRLPLSLLFRQFAAFATVGSANREYFRSLGVPDQRLFFAPHCVDAERFRPDDTMRAAAAAQRTQLGLAAGARVVLFSGKFVPAKQPRELLEAFLAIRAPGTVLVFVGDGGEREALRTAAARAPAGTVHFLPFANQSAMPARYLMADLFVLPSRGLYETWGLAVNEAMHLGVPCLVSDRVGCQRDLVRDGETGWVFPAARSDGLQTGLARAMDDLVLRPGAMGPAIARRISQYTYAAATAGLRQAFDFVLR
ncbi:MAG: glycosyltransferase family 4 protein [Opitutales bacterium]